MFLQIFILNFTTGCDIIEISCIAGDFIINKKRFTVIIILVLIAITALLFIYQDFALLFFPIMAFPFKGMSNNLKAFIIFFTTLLVFLTGKDCLNKKDVIHMKVIYTLIIIADFALVSFKSPVTGISVFFLVQLNLVLRNSKHMKEKIRSAGKAKQRILSSYTFFMCVFYLFAIIFLINALANQTLLLVAMTLYLFMVSLSLWTALTNFITGLFPRTNGLLVFIGMFCFLFCDINVGLSWIFEKEMIGWIAAALIWVFYTPALTLIALSGHKKSTWESK